MPLLAISTVNALGDLGMGGGKLHETSDQRQTTAPLTALSATVMAPDQLPLLMQRAFDLFSVGRARPAHLAIPLDLLEQPAAQRAGRGWRAPLRPPAPRPEQVAEAAARIGAARRAIMIVGGGAVGAGAALAAFVERTRVPVVSTIAGKGILPDAHPLSLGSTLQRPEVRAIVEEADLVIVVGSELAEPDLYVTADAELAAAGDASAIRAGELAVRGEVVRIDVDPTVLRLAPQADVPILGDAALALEMLTDALPASTNASEALDAAAIAALRKRMRARTSPLEAKQIAVLDAIRQALPADGFVAADMTQLAYTGCVHFPCDRPRSWLFPMGYGTMGYALPAAIGAALATPGRPGVAIVGDGGLLFTAQELATAVELELPLAIVLWNNDGLSEIRDFMLARGISPVAVAPRNPDFPALARAFGCDTEQPASLAAVGRAISAAFEKRRPTLIEIREDAPFLAELRA